jgi:[ribosomal protein S5]-alanine N-acetyltransferase
MIPTLITERLRLRKLTLEDALDIFKIFSQNEVTQYYGVKTFTSIQEAINLIQTFTRSHGDHRGMRWGIERKGKKGLIGTIGFNAWSTVHRRAEIGYELHPDFWNNGFATEAVIKTISFGFNHLKLNRIGAIVLLDNEPSIKLLEKVGFENEGILRNYIFQHGLAHDAYVFSLTPPREV